MHLDPFYPQTLREEELKNKVAADWFGPFDCTRIIGNVDFCVDIPATELALGYESEPRLHFQGVTTDAHGKSKMNPTSNDATYNKLLANLRAAMKSLAANIEPKVYEYGFLLR